MEGRVLGRVRGCFAVGFGVEVHDDVEGGFGGSHCDFGFHPCLVVCGECASQYMYARPYKFKRTHTVSSPILILREILKTSSCLPSRSALSPPLSSTQEGSRNAMPRRISGFFRINYCAEHQIFCRL